MSTDYKKLLNKEQYEACITTEGPLLILAGAGSGKTRTITHRIAYMLENGVEPWSVLAITFTNKAAEEMKQRVISLVGPVAENMWISTFHSACLRILRRDAETIGYKRDFSIYDTYDQKSLVKQCISEMNLRDDMFPEREVLKNISRLKDSLITPEDYLNAVGSDYRKGKIAQVYELYQKKLRNNMAMDFDDIIMKTVELFRKDESVLEFYRKKFRYILVDEYQDTNKAQYVLIDLLAQGHRNICVVGDDDQSIYRFRGSDLRNILEFEVDYPDAKVIKLETNYRSTSNIIKAANEVIKNNLGRKDKTMIPARSKGDRIKLFTAFSDNDEGHFVSKEIKKLYADGRNYNEFAVLYRTNAQSRIFEDSFMRNSIPYRLLGGLKFYDRKEIKDIMAYARLLNNPFDEVSLRRIINVPKRAIGDATVDKIHQFALENEMAMFDVLTDIETLGILSGRSLNSVIEFRDLIMGLMADSTDREVSATFDDIVEKTGYLRELSKSRNPEDISRVENIEELINATAQFDETKGGTLQEFLEETALIADVDKYDEDADAVVMMTVHTAKGLEFPVVFMVGMENGLFPGAQSMDDPEEMEESRRLAYVGMTRAKDILYMTRAEARMVYGRTMMYPPSEFLQDIPSEYTEELSEERPKTDFRPQISNKDLYINQKPVGAKPVRKNDTKENFISADSVTVGMKVKHPKFGNGVVLNITPDKNDHKIQIVFDNYGIKNLLLSLAPLTPQE